MSDKRNTSEEMVTKSNLDYRQKIKYHGKEMLVNQAVEELITDKSGTALLKRDFSYHNEILELIDPETQKKIKLTGAQVIQDFHDGLMALANGKSKITVTEKEELKKVRQKLSVKVKDIKTNKNIIKLVKGYELEIEEDGQCPYCGADLVSIVEEKLTRKWCWRRKIYIRCLECGQSSFLSIRS